MTEEEAKTKICPEFRTWIDCDGRDHYSLCKGSDCMMWRWVRNDYAEGYQPQDGHEEYDKGYCGLAGKL